MDDIKNLVQQSIDGLLSESEQTEFEHKIDSDETFRLQVLAELVLPEHLPEPNVNVPENQGSTFPTLKQKITGWKNELKKRFDPLPYLENLVQQSQLQLRAGNTKMLQMNIPQENSVEMDTITVNFAEAIQQSAIIAILNNKSEPLLSNYFIEAGETSAEVDIRKWLPGKYYLIASVEGQPDVVASFYIGNQILSK